MAGYWVCKLHWSNEVLDFNKKCNYLDRSDEDDYLFKDTKNNLLAVVPKTNVEYILWKED